MIGSQSSFMLAVAPGAYHHNYMPLHIYCTTHNGRNKIYFSVFFTKHIYITGYDRCFQL